MKLDLDPEPWPLLVRLRRFMHPSQADVDALRLVCGSISRGTIGENLTEQGAPVRAVILLHEGWAIRHRTLPDGRRQIMDFLLPGDFCAPSVFVTRHTDFAVSAITPVSYSSVTPQALLDAINTSPRLGVYLWWIEAQEAALLRTHLCAVGRMNARERIAHLIWELWTRLGLVLEKPPRAFRLPATQEMIADATGLSVVHVSRTFSRLQKEGVIHRSGHTCQIVSLRRLREIAQVAGPEWPELLPAGISSALEGY